MRSSRRNKPVRLLFNKENLKFRNASASDSEFAFKVKKLAFGMYVSQIWGWDEKEQRQLHQRRFRSQEFSVIQWLETDVGILATAQEPDCLRVNQLFILPEYQGKGIGRECMVRIIEGANVLRYPVRLQVLKINNRACAFFQRLGFKRTGESDTHLFMERPYSAI